MRDDWETADSHDTRDGTGLDMVSAVMSGTIVVGGVHETIRAGKTRIWRPHEWLRDPEIARLFLGLDDRPSYFLETTESDGIEPWRL